MNTDQYLRARKLDKSIPIPLYYQLKEILLALVSGLKPGDSLPTENELCDIFKISRPTVRQAIGELAKEGIIERQKAKGTFVAERKIEQEFLLVLETFNDEMQAKGLTPVTEVLALRIQEAPPAAVKALGIAPEEPVVFLSRRRSIAEEDGPIVLNNTYLPASLLGGMVDKDLVHNSMYRVMEQEFGFSIAYTRRNLEARLAGEYVSRDLGMEASDPVQYIETVAYLENSVPIEYSRAWYRGDMNKFSIEIRKKML